MQVYYLMIWAKPMKHNIEEMNLAGAYINCWILSDNIEEAEKIAMQKIHELRWDILEIEEIFEVTERYYSNNSEGLERYEQALLDKEVYTFHTYESEEEL